MALARQLLSFVLGSIVIVMMNGVLEHCLQGMSMWSKPLSITKMHCSLMWKLFLLEFLNTAIVILLVNSKFGGDARGMLMVGSGDYSDFEFAWYADVAASILLTMILAMFSPHCLNVLSGWLVKKMRMFKLKALHTTEQIKHLYTSPEFDLSVRYSAVLTVLFVSLMYASAIPVLMWTATLTFTLMYWCDKYVLLRASNIPPAHDCSIAKGVGKIQRTLYKWNIPPP
jgi:hypothetical protein